MRKKTYITVIILSYDTCQSVVIGNLSSNAI